MKTQAFEGSCAFGAPGVFRGLMSFSAQALEGYAWALCEIRGAEPGPRLCVSAGVHVNEVSSIEAAIRLQGLFDPAEIRGSVSIMPIINQPALYKYTEYLCPIDGKNINFTFPGDPHGTFSEALCDAIQNAWCAGADCYVDLHGGDLRENVSKFVMFQRSEDSEFEAYCQRLASCFDAELVVGLPAGHMSRPGRPPTGFARDKRVSIMAEAGANGILDEASIAYHVNGVLNIARDLGILQSPQTPFHRARIVCDGYLWVECPSDGQFYAAVEPGDRVVRGQVLGEVRDVFGRVLGHIEAPEDGYVLWRMTHPSLKKGASALAVAVEEKSADMC